MQFVPEDGVYVYFRYDARQTVMVIMNQNEKVMDLSIARFAERLEGFGKLKDVTTGFTFPISSSIQVPAKTVMVFDLQK